MIPKLREYVRIFDERSGQWRRTALDQVGDREYLTEDEYKAQAKEDRPSFRAPIRPKVTGAIPPSPYDQSVAESEAPVPDRPGIEPEGADFTTPPPPPAMARGRAFTDRPDLQGTEAGPGQTWEYIDPSTWEQRGAKPGGQPPPGDRPVIDRDMADAMVQHPGVMRAMSPPGARPPEDARLPDFSPEGRERFRQTIIQEYLGGIDPTAINPSEVLERAEKELIPEIFHNFFRGTRHYSQFQKNLLPPEEMEMWQRRRLEIDADILNKAERQRADGMRVMNDTMSQFDRDAQQILATREAQHTYEIEKAKLEADIAKSQAEGRRKDFEAGQNAAKIAANILKIHHDIGEDQVERYSTVHNSTLMIVTDQTGQYRDSKTGYIEPVVLSALNSVRASVGLPPLVEHQVGRKRFTYLEQPGEGWGGEGGSGAKGGVPLDKVLDEDSPAPPNAVSDLTPEQVEKLRQQFPGATRDANGHWRIPDNQNPGNYLFITTS